MGEKKIRAFFTLPIRRTGVVLPETMAANMARCRDALHLNPRGASANGQQQIGSKERVVARASRSTVLRQIFAQRHEVYSSATKTTVATFKVRKNVSPRSVQVYGKNVKTRMRTAMAMLRRVMSSTILMKNISAAKLAKHLLKPSRKIACL